MAWSNPSLLFGAVLLAAPIVLHLIMRQRPRRLEFPAIRFVKSRQETSRRRLRLRHWLLLLLRCLAIALIALSLARPSVASAAASRWAAAGLLAAAAAGLGLLAAQGAAGGRDRWLVRGLGAAAAVLAVGAAVAGGSAWAGADSPIADQEAPVAAVLVFDASPRMEYQHASRTRLQASAEMALRLIRELPPDSRIAVLDSRREGAFWAADRGAARAAAQRLDATGAPQPLPEVIGDALDLAAGSPLQRREIYVFSDLSAAAWEAAGAEPLAERLRQSPDVQLYVLDVGVDSPRNVALGDIELSAATVPRDGELVVRTSVQSEGVDGRVSVRVDLEQPAPGLPVIQDGEVRLPPAEARGRQEIELRGGEARAVELSLRLDDPGTRQGRVVLETEDALGVDNVRHFAVEVREAWPVLLAAGPDAGDEFMTAALAPADFQDFQCRSVPQDRLATADLEDYAAVCLLDPAPLDDPMWGRLLQYVSRGGSLWVQLGRNALPGQAFNADAPQQLLPAPLLRTWRAPGRDLFLDVRDRSHPALALFRDQTASVPWPALPVFRHWVLGPLPTEARVLAGYSANSHPAVVERPLGDGVVVVSTTPLSEVKYSRNAWNELAYGENNWPPFLLCNELMLYLVRGADQRLNYFTGETVELGNDERLQPRRYQLFLPDEPPQDVTSRDSVLRMPYTDSPGAYRLKGSRGGPVIRGFACNLPEELSRLERLPAGRLDELLGDDRFQLVSDFDRLQRVQDRQRVGREFFSLLMLMLAGVLAVEHLLASRFYRPAPAAAAGESRGPRRGTAA